MAGPTVDPLADFRKAVRDVSSIPVIFVDPNVFHSLGNSQTVKLLDEQLDKQAPGLSEKLTQGDKKEIVSTAALSDGPWAVPVPRGDGTSIGIVVEPKKTFNSKAAIEKLLTGMPAQRVNMPGDFSDYMGVIGAHEGEHLNQQAEHTQDLDKFGMPTAKERGYILSRESGADERAERWAEANGKLPEWRAMQDTRALSLMSRDDTHLTKPVVDGRFAADAATIQGADSARDAVQKQVYACIAKDTGIEPIDVFDMQSAAPELLYQVSKNMLNKGAFNGDPVQKGFVADYVSAYERTVSPPDGSVPRIPSSEHENDLCNGVTIPAKLAQKPSV